MNNFGVIELASAKTTTAPGWAYVPDTTVNRASAPANRKRARNVPGVTIGDLTARQETKRRKEAEALDRDGGRDNTIPIPVKSGRSQGKHTPNVRKILQSQKTFGNHLDDFVALQALAEANPAVTGNSKRPAPSKRDASHSSAARTPARDDADSAAAADVSAAAAATTTTTPSSLLQPPSRAPPAAHPGDDDPLLAARVPDMPTDEELRRLLSHAPLSYGEATGTLDGRYPVRAFCEVCGYWGRVRCMKCGTRVCALDCLEAHREECVTRYGL